MDVKTIARTVMNLLCVKTNHRKPTIPQPLRFEPLEDRVCLTASFDFESEPLAEGLDILSMTDEDLTVTIEKPDSTFAIRSNPVVSDSWGDGFLVPTDFSDRDVQPFVANFSQSVSRVTIDAGDDDGSRGDTDAITIRAYSGLDGTGELLAEQTLLLIDSPGWGFLTLDVAASGIRSVQFSGGSAGFPNSVVWDNLTAEVEPVDVPPTEVTVDVKPGNDDNTVSLRSKGLLSVAILTTDDFDASSIDASTILFGDENLDGRVAAATSTLEDVDGDGDDDLVLRFSLRDITDADALNGESTSVKLTGTTFDGQEIVGSDLIRITGGASSSPAPPAHAKFWEMFGQSDSDIFDPLSDWSPGAGGNNCGRGR